MSVVAAAIPRLDGSDGDGVHLLWHPPSAAGYSFRGWDIQRRDARKRREAECRALTPGELAELHRSLRLVLPIATLSVRQAVCPDFPRLPPDEPVGDPEPPRHTCARFEKVREEIDTNPVTRARLIFEVYEVSGAPAAATRVRQMGNFRGLDVGFQTVIDLPLPSTAVEATLVHFSTPPEVEAFEVDGTSVGVVRMSAAQGTPETLRLAGAALGRIIVRARQDETLLLSACFEARSTRRRRAALPDTNAMPTTTLARLADTSRCVAYDISLPESHDLVEVHAGLPAALAIGFRQGSTVDAQVLTSSSGTQVARFVDRDVDRVVLYARSAASSLQICLDEIPDPVKEEAEWANETYIAKGLQVPIQALDLGLGSHADEASTAKSRLLGSETFDSNAFSDVAAFFNAAASNPDEVSPVWASTLTREAVNDPHVELRSWAYALALLVQPEWRRMLGFGFLDPAAGLGVGQAYDYRIIGRFRRRDVEERLRGFHTVPRGMTLPVTFALGTVELRTPVPSAVSMHPTVPANALTATGRKGIELSGSPCLTLSFPEAVRQVVLEVEPGSSLQWTATTTDFVFGLPVNIFGGSLPPDRRLVIETPDPIDTIELSGTGFLYGLREISSPAGTKPDDIVVRSTVLASVVFQDSAVPPAPAFLGTVNLQQPTVVRAPGAPPTPPASLGFRLSWLPPPPASAATVPWPPDLAAYPPFEALGFHLERRRVDVPGSFTAIDGGGASLVLGSRGGRSDPPALAPGIDIEHAFPERPPPTPPIPVFMSLDDVLVKAATGGPPPGSTRQYQIFSVDAIGRRSAAACLGSVVRLEKRQPPPQPVGPPTPPPAGVAAPAGVRARVLQALDADLAPDDKTLLGTSQNAVVLEWGWTQTERDADPSATEFRVYWEPLAPDVVRGRLTGAPSMIGGRYEIATALDRPVAADAMAGRYLAAPDYPFKVATHTAGQTITVALELSVLDAARVPAAADFEFHPALTGAEQQAASWAERTAVVPITAAESYQQVFRDRLTIDATQARVRVWTGVSAADAQSYIADARPAASLNGGRPGNESAVVAAPASARFLGRPTFTVPPPLPTVPEVVTDEPSGESVAVRLDLPALLPAVTIPAGHRVQLGRIGLDQVVACMSARSDDRIGATLPDGSTQSYTLANPADQTACLAQIRTSTPGQVEGRFLLDFLLRFAGPLEPLWQTVTPTPVPFAAVGDALAAKPERYVHRVRLVDQAGHVSTGAAIPAQIVRVPSLRSPSPPRLRAPTGAAPPTGTLRVEARVRDAYDLSWVALFTTTDTVESAAAQLLRLPNRRDLYPNDGLRLRLADGTVLAPDTVVAASTGTLDLPDRVLSATLAPGPDQRVTLWGIAVTRDGVPSRLAGPLVASTGPAPLVVPALTVTGAAGQDTATWTTATPAALTSLERSVDAGVTWRQVSPWLPETTTTYTLPSATGQVRYRLAQRADRGRTATGTAVTPS